MRVLIVEDDAQLNNALKKVLEKAGYAVDAFHDGAKALRHVEINHNNYDLVILDVLLPSKTGIEICQELRSKDILVPIIMLTGVNDVTKKITALDAGADDYVTKPFLMDELAARVRALLRRPRGALPTEFSVAGLVLKPAHKEAFYNDAALKLTLKEFSILEYLVRNSNQVISRDQILDHVWDFGANAFSNIVDVHVTNLRKKLEKAGAKNILETIRGVGFTIKT